MDITINYVDNKHIIGSNRKSKITTIFNEHTFYYKNPEIIELTKNEVKELKSLILNLRNLTDYCELRYNFNCFNFYTELNSEYTLLTCLYKLDYIKINNSANLDTANFNMKYLSKIFNAISIKYSVKLVFEKNMPMIINQNENIYAIANIDINRSDE